MDLLHIIVRTLCALVIAGLIYFIAAYGIAPVWWTRHERKLTRFAGAPRTTVTKQGIAGDPLNVALIGSREAVIRAMQSAGWQIATGVTLRSSIGIVRSALFGRADMNAPVSPLYVFGRAEDLAFEQTVNGNARRRHHVRFWLSPQKSPDGRAIWVGAVTFDRSIGVSHYTGAITHHIAPNLDEERDRLISGLQASGALLREKWTTGVGATSNGRNGGGDRYFTDGRMAVGVLKDGG